MSTLESDNKDTEAFFATCQKRVRSFIYNHLSAKDYVEDVMQDVFYQYVRVNSLMQPVEQAVAWMLKVARNKIIDLSRKKTEQQLPENAERSSTFWEGDIAEIMIGESSTPDDEYMAVLFWEELETAMAELADPLREAFEQTELKGLSFKQLSETTGVPVNTLLSRKHKAVLYLRARLEEFYDGMRGF